MAATSYKPVTWGEEPTSTAKLNQMANNTQWVYENMPRMLFNAYGVKKTTGVKIISGIAIVPANGALWSSTTVSFGTFFTPGCKPVVVTGHQLLSSKPRFHLNVIGLSENNIDHRGVKIQVGADYYGTSVKNVCDVANAVHYIAVGW
jgi:hypothetical protein